MEMRRIATLETGMVTHSSPVADATAAMLRAMPRGLKATVTIIRMSGEIIRLSAQSRRTGAGFFILPLEPTAQSAIFLT